MADHGSHYSNGSHHHLDKIVTIQHQHLSVLLPYGSLILVTSIILILLVSNLLERWLLGYLYGEIYKTLVHVESERRRRSFVYFHVGAAVMVALFAIGAYPVLSFLAGNAHFSTLLGINSRLTIGDALFIIAEIYCGYYLFELCYRTMYASPISIAHHIGLLVITQTSLALFAEYERHPEATIEFYMCMVWGMSVIQSKCSLTSMRIINIVNTGAFDVVVEMPLYISMIIWRTKRDNHVLLARLTLCLFFWVVLGALVETAVTIYLLKQSWHRWPPTWRVATPMIFTLWISTQLYGSFRLMSMHKSEKRKCNKEPNGSNEVPMA